MNIAVLGHRGMLGQAVMQSVMKREGHVLRIYHDQAWTMSSKRLDTVNQEDLAGVDVVINCAGVTPQRKTDDASMVYTNGYSPHKLADVCDQAKARLIHVSTDCVFSLPGPHTEASPISPHNLYGISKAAGEITREPHLTVRTSFIGLSSTGLLSDLIGKEHVEASKRLLWSGHTAIQVAEYLLLLAEKPEVSGLLHIPGEWINRYDLCLRLAAHFELDVKIIQNNDFFADRRLLSTRWNALGLPEPMRLDEELKAYHL